MSTSKNIPTFADDDTCLADFPGELRKEVRCKAPLNSGLYSLKFLGKLLNKDIKTKICDVNNNFELYNCKKQDVPLQEVHTSEEFMSDEFISEVPTPEVHTYKNIDPKEHMTKYFMIGTHKIPFYYLLLNKFNFITTYLKNEQKKLLSSVPDKAKNNIDFMKNLFVFNSDNKLINITQKGNTLNKYIFINKFKFLMDIVYGNYKTQSDSVPSITADDIKINEEFISKVEELKEPKTSLIIEKIKNDMGPEKKLKLNNYIKNKDTDQKIKDNINDISKLVSIIIKNEDFQLSDDDINYLYYNDIKSKVLYIKNKLETDRDIANYNLYNLSNLNKLQTKILLTKEDETEKINKFINDTNKTRPNNGLEDEIIEILSLINFKETSHSDVQLSILIFLTYFQMRLFIKPVLKYINFESFPINIENCIKELDLQEITIIIPGTLIFYSNTMDDDEARINLYEMMTTFFMPTIPNIHHYSNIMMPDRKVYPDCVETVIFNLVKLFYWDVNEQVYNFHQEDTIFINTFSASLGTEKEYESYSKHFGKLIWNKSQYGFKYTDKRPNYELKSDMKNILLIVYHLLITKATSTPGASTPVEALTVAASTPVEALTVAASTPTTIKDCSIDELITKINEIICKYNETYSLSYDESSIKFKINETQINILVNEGHAEFDTSNEISKDMNINIFNKLFDDIKNIINYIDIKYIVDIIILNDNMLSFKYLKKCNTDMFNDIKISLLYKALQHKVSIDIIKFIINKTTIESINRSYDGCYIINEVLKQDYPIEIIKLLFDKGITVNLDNELYPSLFFAIETEDKKIINMIISKSPANTVNCINKNGEIALYSAIRTDKTDIIEKILQLTTNLSIKHTIEGSILNYALKYCFFNENIQLLLDNKMMNADIINMADNNCNTSLHTAIINNDVEKDIIISLINKNANVDLKNNDGNTALHLALMKTFDITINKDESDIISAENNNKLIIYDTLLRDDMITSSIHDNLKKLDKQIMKLLETKKEYDEETEEYEDERTTILEDIMEKINNIIKPKDLPINRKILSAISDLEEIYEKIIEKYYMISIKIKNNIEYKQYNDEIVKLLISKISDINIKNNEGQTILELARKNYFNSEIIDLIVSKGVTKTLIGGNFYILSNFIKNKMNKYYYKIKYI